MLFGLLQIFLRVICHHGYNNKFNQAQKSDTTKMRKLQQRITIVTTGKQSVNCVLLREYGLHRAGECDITPGP